MNTFGQPPEDLDYSIPLEPMKLNVIGESQFNLKTLLSDLVDKHPTKLTRDQRQGVRDVYRQILLNVIFNSNRRIYTALPRGTNAFTKGTYWSKCGLTAKFTSVVLDQLVEQNLIVQMIGFYNGLGGVGKLTRIYGTDLLANQINIQGLCDAIDFEWDDEALQVVLAGFPYKSDILPVDHDDVIRVREINIFLKEHHWQQRGPIRIIYKDDPVRGGRVYTRFQNMPKAFRLEMLIDGKPVVELDYKANHLMMLIAILGISLPADPYLEIANKAGCTRDQIKSFITSSLGASDELKAFQSLTSKGFNKVLFNRIKDVTLSLYPGIPLFRGFGVMMQSLEGQIALDVMFRGAKTGIVVLPVHDSFITTVEHEEWLFKEMEHQWRKHLGVAEGTRIEKKIRIKDYAKR